MGCSIDFCKIRYRKDEFDEINKISSWENAKEYEDTKQFLQDGFVDVFPMDFVLENKKDGKQYDVIVDYSGCSVYDIFVSSASRYNGVDIQEIEKAIMSNCMSYFLKEFPNLKKIVEQNENVKTIKYTIGNFVVVTEKNDTISGPDENGDLHKYDTKTVVMLPIRIDFE